jgi:hypothetical protein
VLDAPDARARRADAARLGAAARAAVESARQLEREQPLAQPLLAREEQRRRHAPLRQHPAQSLFRALVPDQFVEHDEKK